MLSNSSVEQRFRDWVLDWEQRVLGDCAKAVAQQRANLPYYSFSLHFCETFNKSLEKYHVESPEQLGRDRFVWTSMAYALVYQHNQHFYSSKVTFGFKHGSLDKSLYLLLLVGFYLKIKERNLISLILKQILKCTNSLEFLFCYIPGMSLSVFESLLRRKQKDAEKTMCQDYLYMLDSVVIFLDYGEVPTCSPSEIYRYSAPYLRYIVDHLIPYHDFCDGRFSQIMVTIRTLLNSPITEGRKDSLLSLAIHFNDVDFVKDLVQRGASLQTEHWSPGDETVTSGEKMLVKVLNALMVSNHFLANTGIDMTRHIESFTLKSSTYLPLLKRSLLKPRIRKASTIWTDVGQNSSDLELNRSLANEWGVESKPECPSLLHTSKITIRNSILQADVSSLPSAIQTLPLPVPLKKYLNLLLD